MARSFNGTSDRITYPALPFSVTANTLSLWFYSTAAQTISSYYTLHDRTVSGSGTHSAGIFASGAAANKMSYFSSNVSIDPGTNVYSANVWNHVGLILSGTGATMSAFLNGVADGTGSWNNTVNTTSILGSNGANANFAGRLADFAFWTVALSTFEIAALARGIRPWRIRPSSLQIYSPLDGLSSPEPDLSGGKNNGTLTGTGLAFGPPFTLFFPARFEPFVLNSTLMPQSVM